MGKQIFDVFRTDNDNRKVWVRSEELIVHNTPRAFDKRLFIIEKICKRKMKSYYGREN